MGKAFGTSRRWLITITLSIFIIIYLAWSEVPDYLSSQISKKMKVSVQIGDIDFTPWKLVIQKLHIGNPPGCKLAEALSCETIEINALVTQYLKKAIIIDSIVIGDVYLGLEFDSATEAHGNWTKLMASLKSLNAQESALEAKESKRSVLIKKLIIRNIKTDVLYKTSSSNVNHLPVIDELEFDNISSEGGFPVDELMSSVLGKMLMSVFEKENIKNMLQNILDPESDLQNILSPFKSLFNANIKEAENISLQAA